MKNICLLSIIKLAAFSILIGCAHLGGGSEELRISDIEGTWESISFAYFFLEIKDASNGYFISVAEGNENEIYKIVSTVFSGSTFIMKLKEIDGDNEESNVEGFLLGKNILTIRPVNEDENTTDEIMFFMREYKVPELRERAKRIIKGIE